MSKTKTAIKTQTKIHVSKVFLLTSVIVSFIAVISAAAFGIVPKKNIDEQIILNNICETDFCDTPLTSQANMLRIRERFPKIETEHFTIHYQLNKNFLVWDEEMPTKETVITIADTLEKIWQYYFTSTAEDGGRGLDFKTPPDTNIETFFNVGVLAAPTGVGGSVTPEHNQLQLWLNSTNVDSLLHEMMHISQAAYGFFYGQNFDNTVTEGTAVWAQTLWPRQDYSDCPCSFSGGVSDYFLTPNVQPFVSENLGIENITYTSGLFWRYMAERFTTDAKENDAEIWYSAEFMKDYFHRLEVNRYDQNRKDELSILSDMIADRSDGLYNLEKAFRDFAIMSAIWNWDNPKEEHQLKLGKRPYNIGTKMDDRAEFVGNDINKEYTYEANLWIPDLLTFFPAYAMNAYQFETPNESRIDKSLFIDFEPENENVELIIIKRFYSYLGHDNEIYKIVGNILVYKGTLNNHRIDLYASQEDINQIYFRVVSFGTPGGKYKLSYHFE